MYAISMPHQRKTILLPLLVLVLGAGIAGMVALSSARLADRIPFMPDSSADGHTIAGAFLYQQQRPLSCEYASVHIATTMAGHSVSEYAFDDVVPLNKNPHLGYRGNIHGEWGNTTDYGIYNEPLATALDQFGVRNETFYAMGDRSALTAQLDRGRPTVVWLAIRGDVNSFDVWSDGARYQLTQWMHVMVAYGYDEQGVYLTDPGTKVWRFYPWHKFMTMWNVMDGMALSVYP